jgi:RIO kinase 1
LSDDPFQPFFEEGYITDVVRQISGGKEASIWLCRAGEFAGDRDLVVAKVYRDREHRDFRNRRMYVEGRVVLDERAERALHGKTRFGARVDEGLWQGHEYEVLRHLHGSGAPVPEPIASSGEAMLLAYVGDDDGPAPQLRELRPDPDECADLWRQLRAAIERMLRADVVHGDLSPFNVLVDEGRIVVIDLPQAVDPRTNPNAFTLLQRDLHNVTTWFAKHGVEVPDAELATDLWTAWEFADLVPDDLVP